MNTNVARLVLNRIKELEQQGLKVEATAIGGKGFGFLGRLGAKVVSHVVQLGDTPHLDKLIGAVKVQLDAYAQGQLEAVYLAYTRFVNTMKQEAVIEQLLPLTDERLAQPAARPVSEQTGDAAALTLPHPSWDYIYEPDAQSVVDDLLVRYVEALVYQSVAENMASEQSARMVAMKAASDNAKSVISDLQLLYNKSRQAAITKELSEIVGGAAAVA
jgi:F-type H+-transporting ATPase subunit gamma